MTNHHPPTALTGGPPPIFSLFCEHVVFERKNQKTLEPPLISVRLGYYNVLLVLQAPASAAHSLHAPPLPLPSRSPAQPQPRAQPLPSFSSAAAATSARTASGRRSTRPCTQQMPPHGRSPSPSRLPCSLLPPSFSPSPPLQPPSPPPPPPALPEFRAHSLFELTTANRLRPPSVPPPPPPLPLPPPLPPPPRLLWRCCRFVPSPSASFAAPPLPSRPPHLSPPPPLSPRLAMRLIVVLLLRQPATYPEALHGPPVVCD